MGFRLRFRGSASIFPSSRFQNGLSGSTSWPHRAMWVSGSSALSFAASKTNIFRLIVGSERSCAPARMSRGLYDWLAESSNAASFSFGSSSSGINGTSRLFWYWMQPRCTASATSASVFLIPRCSSLRCSSERCVGSPRHRARVTVSGSAS